MQTCLLVHIQCMMRYVGLGTLWSSCVVLWPVPYNSCHNVHLTWKGKHKVWGFQDNFRTAWLKNSKLYFRSVLKFPRMAQTWPLAAKSCEALWGGEPIIYWSISTSLLCGHQQTLYRWTLWWTLQHCVMMLDMMSLQPLPLGKCTQVLNPASMSA